MFKQNLFTFWWIEKLQISYGLLLEIAKFINSYHAYTKKQKKVGP